MDARVKIEYARFTRQPDGDYVSGSGAQVNGEILRSPHLLRQGDIISLGATRLEYMLVPDARTTPLPMLSVPPIARPISGPVPFLRLPSKPK